MEFRQAKDRGGERHSFSTAGTHMFFNLDASNRPVIGLEGRTCCYLCRVQT